MSGDLAVDGRFSNRRADLCEFVEALDPEEAIPRGSVVGWRFGEGVTLHTTGAQVGAALPATQRGLATPCGSDCLPAPHTSATHYRYRFIPVDLKCPRVLVHTLSGGLRAWVPC